MGSFLIGIGCSSKAAPSSVPYMPRSAASFKLSADPEKEPLEGFLPPEDSKKWLNDNHFLFWAQAEDYIIISEDDYSSRLVIPRGSRVSISGSASAVVTIDTQGQLRVAPINTQE